MNTIPTENRELRALGQHRRLHKSTDKLQARLEAGIREHFPAAVVFVSVLGLGLGYCVAGIFTKH